MTILKNPFYVRLNATGEDTIINYPNGIYVRSIGIRSVVGSTSTFSLSETIKAVDKTFLDITLQALEFLYIPFDDRHPVRFNNIKMTASAATQVFIYFA